MWTDETQAKLVETLEQLEQSIDCPNCAKAKAKLSLNCGHSFCETCIQLYLPSQNEQCSTKVCPLCDKEIVLENVCEDKLINSLAKETAFIKSLICKNKSSKCDQSIVDSEDCMNAVQGVCTDLTEQHEPKKYIVNDAARPQFVNVQQQTSPKKYTTKMQQTEVRTVSVATQCESQCPPTVLSVATQTDQQIAIGSSSHKCCLQANLQKLLNLNMCSTFNAILLSLLSESNDFDCSEEKSFKTRGWSQSHEVKLVDGEQQSSYQQSNDQSVNNIQSITKQSKNNDESIEVSALHSLEKIATNTTKENILEQFDSIENIKNQEDKLAADCSIVNHVEVEGTTQTNNLQEQKEVYRIKTRNKHKSIVEKNLKTSKRKAIQQIATDDKRSDKSCSSEDSRTIIPNANLSAESTNKRKRLSPNDLVNLESFSTEMKGTKKERKPKLENKLTDHSKNSKSLVSKSEDTIESRRLTKTKNICQVEQSEQKETVSEQNDSLDEKLDTSIIVKRARRSSGKKSYVIMCSGLDSTLKRKVGKCASQLGFEIVANWNDRVTHLVVQLAKDFPKEKMLTMRSAKYLQALLGKRWIVSIDWLFACQKCNRMISEENYEIQGFRNCAILNCPKTSRNSDEYLFMNYCIYFEGSFKNFPIEIEEVKILVTIGRGQLVDTRKQFQQLLNKNHETNHQQKLVVVVEKSEQPILFNHVSVKQLTINQFIDAVSNLQCV